ncbi:MAG: sigma-54-dependent Fis family transcriptional regulator [Planctomycetes bacterium]|nr:sigma-54-dependent Fis family transcriptional regulator [Planctomycetota bacterium]
MNQANGDHRVLLVDDDDAFRSVLAAELTRRGHVVETAADGRRALTQAQLSGVDVVLLDLRLPDLDGIEVLKRMREQDLPAGIVVLTGHGTIDTAIQAIRLGAHDYLEKPCPIDKVEMVIRKTREHLTLLARQRVLQDGYSPPDVRSQLVGACAAVHRLRESVARIARADATTLILGETGVGKDLVAKILHTEGPRRDATFVVVDCASLHEELLQSELFGHEKGSFSGAGRLKHGLFEVANGGTLFLDEVGETSRDIQAMLLRVLETGRFRRVGGTQEIAVNVRIVSATNRDLQRAVAQGRFRQDLYFRLSTFTIEVPPLRERADDIPLLVAHFVDHFNRRFERTCKVGDEALAELLRHDWPGNVRELIHVLEQAVVLCDGEIILPAHLPLSRSRAPDIGSSVEPELPTLRELQQRHIREVLVRVGQNRGRAARILGISERNLYRLLKRIPSRPDE